jgi:hypothetical protein
MRGQAVAEQAATPKPVAITPTKKKDPRKAAAPATDDTVETAPVEITPENWRNYRETPGTVHVLNEQPIRGVTI